MTVPAQHVDEVRRAHLAYQEDTALQDVCDSNGLTREDFVHGRLHVQFLEMFLTDFSSLQPMIYFPGLKVLQVMHCDIKEIVCLEHCPSLEKLWLNENSIGAIGGLDQCTQLVELYLYSNQIQRIEGLSTLGQLEVLWLMDNQIRHVEGLDNLSKLRSLNLAANRIEHIGRSLDPNTALQELNLSGNRFGSFRDIPPLDRLPQLTTISFADPHFGDNPLCHLCNYQTYALYHLSGVTRLDTLLVTEEQRHAAETTFIKKRMYYNMRIKTLKRNSSALLRRAIAFKESKVAEVTSGLNHLCKTVKILDRELEEPRYLTQAGLNGIGAAAPAVEIGEHRQLIQRCIDEKQRLLAEMEHQFQEMKDTLASTTAHCVSKLMVELQTGGNVRIEEGRPTDVWFKSCVDLFKSRFFPGDFEAFGLSDVKVVKVARLHNRHLRTRFENRLADVIDTSEASHKRALEYLFYGEDPEIPGELLNALEDGYRRASEFEALGKDYGIPMTNSVFLCDQARLMHLMSNGLIGNTISGPALTGRALITKVFLGKCAPEKEMDCSRSPNTPLISRRQDNNKIYRKDYAPQTTSVFRMKPGDPKQRVWFAFDHSLAFPEYLVEWVYVPSVPRSQIKGAYLQQDVEELHEVITTMLPSQSESDAADMRSLAPDFIAYMQHCNWLTSMDRDTSEVIRTPLVRQRQKILELSTLTIPAVCADQNPGTTLYLSLVGVGIKKVETLHCLSRLKVLTLAFNEIQRIDAIQDLPCLERLDLSYNRVRRLEGLKGLPSLRQLDLSHNYLQRSEEINTIKRLVPNITDLNLAGNSLCEFRHYKWTAIRRIPTLATLDGTPVTQHDKDMAGEKLASISNQLLLERGYVGPVLLWSKPIAPFNNQAKQLDADGRWYGPPEEPIGTLAKELIHPLELGYRVDDRFSGVLSRIVHLELPGMGLRKIQNMESLANLRKLNLSGNDISRIEGLEGCGRLEELSLEENRISKIEGLTMLLNLRKLDLGGNQLNSLESLEALPNLAQLGVEDNGLSSLAGITMLQNLLELYAGNNRLENLEEVHHLRPLFRLIILDLCGNPLCRDPEYRLATIYNLKKLKVLDGVGVEHGESAMAKDVFMGKMSPEILVERAGVTTDWSSVKDLDLAGMGLKELGLLGHFTSLQHLRLENNLLVDLCGLQPCRTLRTINLSFNRLSASQPPGHVGQCLACCVDLQGLELEGNGITSLAGLGLKNRSLTRLNLRSNELVKLDGLEALKMLQELYVDKNKLRILEASSLSSLASLHTFYANDNLLKNIDGLRALPALRTLHLVSNRVSELAEFDALEYLMALQEVYMASNSVARKPGYRCCLVHKAPSLQVIDGHEVTAEERDRAAALFAGEHQYSSGVGTPTTSNSTRSGSSQNSAASGQHYGGRPPATPNGNAFKYDAAAKNGSTSQRLTPRGHQPFPNGRSSSQENGAFHHKSLAGSQTKRRITGPFSSPHPPGGAEATRLPRV